MSPEPASLIVQAVLDPRRVIGLFLTHLFAYLVRLQASGQTAVPKDIACMVSSAEAMVNHVIRTLAAKQLREVGYTDAARALRDPEGLRNARKLAQSTSAADSLVCSREAEVRIEHAQGCEPDTPEDLIHRLQTTIEAFERADEMASLLVRMIVCAMVYVFPETRERPLHARNHADHGIEHCRVSLGPPKPIPVGRGPPYAWPPQVQTSCVFWFPGLRPGQLRRVRTITSTAFPERGRASGIQKPD